MQGKIGQNRAIGKSGKRTKERDKRTVTPYIQLLSLEGVRFCTLVANFA